jgi:chromosome segregation ATPase
MSNEQVVQQIIEQLEKTFIEDLRKEIRSEFKSIHDRMDRLEETFDLWKTDFDEDRETLHKLRTTGENLNVELKEIGSTVDKLPHKIDKTIQKSAKEAIPKAINDTFIAFGKRVQLIKKPLFSRFFNWKWR